MAVLYTKPTIYKQLTLVIINLKDVLVQHANPERQFFKPLFGRWPNKTMPQSVISR